MATKNAALLATIKKDTVRKRLIKKAKQLQEQLDEESIVVQSLIKSQERLSKKNEEIEKLKQEKKEMLAIIQTLLNGCEVLESNGEAKGQIWWAEDSIEGLSAITEAGYLTRDLVTKEFEYRSRGEGTYGVWAVKGSAVNCDDEWVL